MESPSPRSPAPLFDLATVLRPRQLERALNEAEALRLWNELSLPDLLHRYPGRSGAAAIRALLAVRDEGATIIRGLEVDCLWRAQRLAVELDSRDFHSTRAAFERDRERDRLLQVAGWRPVRVTWRQLHRSPKRLARDLQRLLSATTLAA